MVPLIWPKDISRELDMVRRVSQSQWPTEVLQQKTSQATQKARSAAVAHLLPIICFDLQLVQACFECSSAPEDPV